MRFEMVGYWSNGDDNWPRPEEMIDVAWSIGERTVVADYLSRGLIARVYLGKAVCRICGEVLGCMDLSDGCYMWPQGLEHYVLEHAVRLPVWFVDHVLLQQQSFEDAQVCDTQWSRVRADK
ncbi:MAG: hypothetical protein LBG99_03320 [Propionibacteriaceae bacterium]|nr:hypothetical protein [Propionibacteriaceae bacterium]